MKTLVLQTSLWFKALHIMYELLRMTYLLIITLAPYPILIDWLFIGTSTQKGQFLPTVGEENRLSRLRMANEIQCIIPHLHDNYI